MLGLRRATDNSLLAQARRDNATLRDTNATLINEKAEMTTLLASREQLLQKQERELADSTAELSRLRALVPPYGKGYGLLTVINGCDCRELNVSIDGLPAGHAATTRYRREDCGVVGAVTVALMPGVHHVAASDARGHHWDLRPDVGVDKCTTRTLVLRR